MNESSPMTGFEPRTSGVGSDRSTNWVTDTTNLFILGKSRFGPRKFHNYDEWQFFIMVSCCIKPDAIWSIGLSCFLNHLKTSYQPNLLTKRFDKKKKEISLKKYISSKVWKWKKPVSFVSVSNQIDQSLTHVRPVTLSPWRSPPVWPHTLLKQRSRSCF